jgi:signal transduction histidine kinase/CheY-like chemotaxis protein
LHHKSRDGRELVVESRWTLVRDEAGAPRGVLAVNTDVTAQRSVQAQLMRSQRLENLGTLAGGIAHDLNNVLAPILMGVQALGMDDATGPTRRILDIIGASARRGADIVRQILHFARGMEGTHGEMQIRHVLREVDGMIRETFPRSIRMELDVATDLWPVIADGTQMEQVLMNLCVNARDAMPDGGTLTLSAANVTLDADKAAALPDARPQRYAQLTVRDTGTGIPVEIQERIFDPFFSTKDPGKGTGLGLAITRSIVKGHGGFMTVTSTEGGGTTFRVHIPAAAQGTAPAREVIAEQLPRGRGELVLVVDDEMSLRDTARQVLEAYGYRALTAANGREALARFADAGEPVRLVLTDLMMPSMDGPTMIKRLRATAPHVPVIAMSGLMPEGAQHDAVELDVAAFLAKPYTAEALLRTLRLVLDGPALR